VVNNGVGFVVDKVAQGQIFLPVLPFFFYCLYHSTIASDSLICCHEKEKGAKLGNLPQKKKKERCFGSRVALDRKIFSLGL